MTTQEIAKRLAELCRKGDFETAQNELYAKDIVSIEQHPTPDFDKEIKGLDAVKKKRDKWNSMVEEMNGVEVSEPVIAGNSFALTMKMDVVMKGRGKMDMTELCVYTVKDGKIASEEFFMQDTPHQL